MSVLVAKKYVVHHSSSTNPYNCYNIYWIDKLTVLVFG